MIIAVILQLILAAIGLVLSPILFLPDVSLNSAIPSALAAAGAWLGLANEVLPLATMLIVFGTILVVENTHFGYKVLKWIYQKIPGVN